MYRYALAWLLSVSAWAGTAELSWTAPTQNVDGTPITLPLEYRLWRTCDGGQTTQVVQTPALAYNDNVEAQTCSWWVSALTTDGESARTGPVSKSFAAALPGSVSATFSWQIEAPAVAKSLVGESQARAEAATSTGNLTWPATDAGDFAVLTISAYNNLGNRTLSAVSGFTALLGPVGVEGTGTGTNTTEGHVLYRECDGAESGTFVVSFDGSVYAGATLAVYRGDGALTYKASSLGTLARGNSSDAAATAAGVSAAVGDLIVMPTMLSDPPGTTNSDPSGLGLIAEGNTVTNTSWIHAGESASSGSTGTKTWDFTNTRNWLTYQFLVEDAGAGGATASLPPINRSARMAAMIAH